MQPASQGAAAVNLLTEAAIHTRELDLSSRNLSSVPPSVAACGGLVLLNLSCNSLEHLPEELCDLPTLCELDVSFNKLLSLPAALGQLQHLSSLKASYNQLATLPQGVSALTALQELHLGDNQLQHLPGSCLERLVSLTDLHLQYNGLQYLPVQLGELPSLTRLQLEGNPLRHAPLAHLVEAGAASPNGVDLERLRRLLPLQPQPQAQPRPGSSASAGEAAGGSGRPGTAAAAAPGRSPSGIAAAAAASTPPRPGSGRSPSEGVGTGMPAHSTHAERTSRGPRGGSLGAAGAGPGASGSAVGSPGDAQRRISSGSEVKADILLIDSDGGAGDRSAAMGSSWPHDAEVDAGDDWSRLGHPTDDATTSGDPLSASEAAALQEVADLPPAAAAVLYRTWDAVRTGSREMTEGRPLTRGGTAGSHGSSQAARQLLASSSGKPPRSARPRTGAPGTASGTRRPLTSAGSPMKEIAMPLNQPPALPQSPGAVLGAAGGAFDSLPPITFPLTSGVRSMLRRMSSASESEGRQCADAAADAAKNSSASGHAQKESAGLQGQGHATLRGSSSWGAGSTRVSGGEGVGVGGVGREGEGEGEGDSLDLVRQLLCARNPDLLKTLDSALQDDDVGDCPT